MEEKILNGLISSFVSQLVNESKFLFQNLSDEGKQFLNIDLKSYLERQKNKYSYIKTLLRGSAPVFLYEIYYPLKLEYDNKVINTNSITNIFQRSSYITILGDAGSGKSTLIKHLFLNAIKTKYAIPVLIELRYLNDYDNDIITYIFEKIFENSIAQNSSILKRLLKKKKFIFFLDGYDELNTEVKNKVTERLNLFIELYQGNKFILTSRPYSNIEHFPMFFNYEIKELNKKEILGFIDKQLKDENELALKIKKSVKENKNLFIESFLNNPLLLSLYILTYQSNASIPNKKFIFYRRVINALFAEHDSKTKLGFVREKSCGLSQEIFEEVLKRFCFVSFFEAKYEFDFEYLNSTLSEIKSKIQSISFETNKFIQDLKLAVALWVEDNGYYSFAHRSLQEYFAASFIKKLTEQQKKIVYNKIRNKDIESSFIEIENLLSLCEEMDKLNFNKFYSLPLLNELKNRINNRNNYTLVKSVVQIFVRYIYPYKKLKNFPYRRIIIAKDVWKYFYFTIEFFRLINEELEYILSVRANIKILLPYLEKRNKHTEIQELDILSTNEKEVFNIFLTNKLIKYANNLSTYVDDKIRSTEKYINTKTEYDKEIIDMI